MRGDRPLWFNDKECVLLFTPHARGSTFVTIVRQFPAIVYPACAGIDLLEKKVDFSSRRLPRMRGDRPLLQHLGKFLVLFTPHARGSTDALEYSMPSSPVYPACAGIDPTHNSVAIFKLGLPRMRGDRP